MRTIALRADPPAGSLLAPAPLPPPGACQLGRLPIPMSDIRGNEGKEHERGREGGEIRTDVPLATLVESLLVLVGGMRPDRDGRRNGSRGHELNRATTVPHRRPPGRRLMKAQLAAGADHPPQLGERLLLVVHQAEHESMRRRRRVSRLLPAAPRRYRRRPLPAQGRHEGGCPTPLASSVVQSDTGPTTHVLHRLYRVVAGLSRFGAVQKACSGR
jgi:hypothetical protein